MSRHSSFPSIWAPLKHWVSIPVDYNIPTLYCSFVCNYTDLRLITQEATEWWAGFVPLFANRTSFVVAKFAAQGKIKGSKQVLCHETKKCGRGSRGTQTQE
jgi:hypothetical protein